MSIIAASVSAITVTAACGSIILLHTRGICIEQWRVLPEDEAIASAVAHLLKDWYYLPKDYDVNDTRRLVYDPYVISFMKANPGCCKIDLVNEPPDPGWDSDLVGRDWQPVTIFARLVTLTYRGADTQTNEYPFLTTRLVNVCGDIGTKMSWYDGQPDFLKYQAKQ